jgi:hypothetical protein
VVHCPSEDQASQWKGVSVEIAKSEECDDALRDTMDVDGIRAVVEVMRCAVLTKEVGCVEVKSSSSAQRELVRLQVPVNLSQRAQVVPGVEVIDPMLLGSLSIRPRAIVALTGHGVPSDPQGRFQKPFAVGQPVYAAKKSGAEKVCVVNLSPDQR